MIDDVALQVSAARESTSIGSEPMSRRSSARWSEHDLVVEADDGEIGSGRGERNGDYVAPVLESFTDMQDLILLDPIHEVDAAGWPNTATP